MVSSQRGFFVCFLSFPFFIPEFSGGLCQSQWPSLSPTFPHCLCLFFGLFFLSIIVKQHIFLLFAKILRGRDEAIFQLDQPEQILFLPLLHSLEI